MSTPNPRNMFIKLNDFLGSKAFNITLNQIEEHFKYYQGLTSEYLDGYTIHFQYREEKYEVRYGKKNVDPYPQIGWLTSGYTAMRSRNNMWDSGGIVPTIIEFLKTETLEAKP